MNTKIVITIVMFFSCCGMSAIRIEKASRCASRRMGGVILQKPVTSGSILTPLLCDAAGARSVTCMSTFGIARLGQGAVYVDMGRGGAIKYVQCLSDCVCFSEGNVFIRNSRGESRAIPCFSKVRIGDVIVSRGLSVGKSAMLGATMTLSAVFRGGSVVPSRVRFSDDCSVDLVCKSVAIRLKGSTSLRRGVGQIVTVLPGVRKGGNVLRVRDITARSGAFRRRLRRGRIATRG